METEPVLETLCFLVFRILDAGQSQKIQQFWAKKLAMQTAILRPN
jgi:hypothetical protein